MILRSRALHLRSGLLGAGLAAAAAVSLACGDGERARGDPAPIDYRPGARPTPTYQLPAVTHAEASPGLPPATPAADPTVVPEPGRAQDSAAPEPPDAPSRPGAAVRAPAGVTVVGLAIPRFGVTAGVEYLGILPSNELDSPHNPYNTGWYVDFDFLGAPGNAVFAGHVDYFPNILGPFHRLQELGPGDEVVISLSSGAQLRYRVFRNTRYLAAEMPMGAILWPGDRPADDEWVTMITCGGEFRATTASGAGEYLHRDVVVARRVPEAGP